MTLKLQDHLYYSAGPYKGYMGRAEYNPQARLFHGEVVGTKDVITFQAKTPAGLRKAFVGSVDDYLSFCQARGEKPEKPFSGRFVARIAPDLHRRISLLAEERGTSLNALVEQSLAQSLAARSNSPKKNAKTAAKARVKRARPKS